jgi:hypothetical protein
MSHLQFVWTAVHTPIDTRVKKNQLDANLFLVYFTNLYMFRAYLGRASGGTTICIQHLVFIILFRGLSVVLDGLDNRVI